jgi:hypothetical protein
MRSEYFIPYWGFVVMLRDLQRNPDLDISFIPYLYQVLVTLTLLMGLAIGLT